MSETLVGHFCVKQYIPVGQCRLKLWDKGFSPVNLN